jgi:hypothetical protein
MESRRTDHSTVLAVNRDESATGSQRIVKELSEHIPLAAISIWMLLPDQRVGRNCIQPFEVVGSKWPQLQQLAGQQWLKVK